MGKDSRRRRAARETRLTVEAGKTIVEGYAIVFDQEYYGGHIFTKDTVFTAPADMPLVQYDNSGGRKTIGKVNDVEADEVGLKFRAELPNYLLAQALGSQGIVEIRSSDVDYKWGGQVVDEDEAGNIIRFGLTEISPNFIPSEPSESDDETN
jgi:hypothetical protein